MTTQPGVNEQLNVQLIDQVQRLEAEVQMARAENERLIGLMGRQTGGVEALRKILEYMPQLTFLNNSTSTLASETMKVGSNLVAINATLTRIAEALTKETP